MIKPKSGVNAEVEACAGPVFRIAWPYDLYLAHALVPRNVKPQLPPGECTGPFGKDGVQDLGIGLWELC